MTISSSDPESGHNRDAQAHLVVAVLSYQATAQELQATTDEAQRALLRVQLQEHGLAIWEELKPYLIALAAQRWRYSEQMASILAGLRSDETYTDALQSLALSMFWPILPELPKRTIDPERNVRAYLLTIISRQMHKTEARIYSNRPRKNVIQIPLPSSRFDGDEGGGDEDIPDERHADHEERLIAQLARADCWRAVQEFWRQTLNEIDFLITQARWVTDPPQPFAAIAAQLGDGYTEDAIRKRHQRIMEKTRAFLQEQGWDACP